MSDVEFHAKKGGVFAQLSNLVANPHTGACPEFDYQSAKFGKNEKICCAFQTLLDLGRRDAATFIELLHALQPEKKDWNSRKDKHWFYKNPDTGKQLPVVGILAKLMQFVLPSPKRKSRKAQERRWKAFCRVTGCEVTYDAMVTHVKASVPWMSKEAKRELMIKCQIKKFKDAPLRQLLLDTEDRQLVEVPSRGHGKADDLWSRGPNGGHNLCGECLMEVRNILREQTSFFESESREDIRGYIEKLHAQDEQIILRDSTGNFCLSTGAPFLAIFFKHALLATLYEDRGIIRDLFMNVAPVNGNVYEVGQKYGAVLMYDCISPNRQILDTVKKHNYAFTSHGAHFGCFVQSLNLKSVPDL